MKKTRFLVISSVYIFFLFSSILPAQERGGRGVLQVLTEDQKAAAKKVLMKYNAAGLSAEDAKAIHKALRDIGIRGGRAEDDVLSSAGFDPKALKQLDPPPNRPEGDSRKNSSNEESGKGAGKSAYNIEQAISDRAQLNTIAFDALAFLTGNTGCNTFLPPGKVSDFFGFQYMRDVDQGEKGHSTSFVPKSANNMLFILTAEQRARLVALAGEQEAGIKAFAYKRFPLVQAFSRQLKGEFPSGRIGLNKKAVMDYSAELYAFDGELSYRRAEVLGEIIRNFSSEQRAALDKILTGNSQSWPERADQLDKKGMSHRAHAAAMTYASEMFSWYAGNVEADAYFCPERHAMYFGSFYMKDIPAMGNKDYTISTSLTGESGESFLAALNAEQRKLITSLVDQQKRFLIAIVEIRRSISTELRRFMKEKTIDKAKVILLSKKYGELDGAISYLYAVAFADVKKSLTANQHAALMKLRNLDAKYEYNGAFEYSEKIAMPAIMNTDFLFGGGK